MSTYIGNFNTSKYNKTDSVYTYYIQIGPDVVSPEVAKTITDPTNQNIYSPAAGTVVMFDTDPVTIEVDRGDLMNRIIISQATINLLSNDNLTDDLFANTNRSIPVTITKSNQVVFFGYVDPLQFNQGYAHNWETIQITATDPLGALQDVTVDKIHKDPLNYILADESYTPADFISKIFATIGINGIDVDNYSSHINATVLSWLKNTNLKMSIFFGDSEDDRMTLYDALTEVCKYFNLYVAYYNNTVNITCTINYNPTEKQFNTTNTPKFKDIAYDDSTTLSTDDVYSQINLTCEIEPVEDGLISFSDDDFLRSDYDNYERYMTEYWAEGNGESAYDAFCAIINGRSTRYDAAYWKEHYAWIRRNDSWSFGNSSYITYMGGAEKTDNTNATPMTGNQINVLKYLKDNSCKGALISIGSGDDVNARIVNDNTPQSNIGMKDYLVISVNGNCTDTNEGGEDMQDIIDAGNPICEYKGLISGILSPSDPRVTNYIILSGNITLNPLQPLSGTNWRGGKAGRDEPASPDWTAFYDTTTNTWASALQTYSMNSSYNTSDGSRHTVALSDNAYGSYYQQRWDTTGGANGVYGFLNNNKNQLYQYKGTYNEHMNDTISKLPILACSLKIGDNPSTAKYCVERLDLGQEGVGQFEWYTLTELSDLSTELGYETPIQPYFTIGIDPKKDDYLIGQSFTIQNNVNHRQNISVTGTAIPITLDDHLAGKIEFKILGPYNTLWTDLDVIALFGDFPVITSINNHYLLQHIQSILLENFKISTASDNGLINAKKTTADNDLVYASNMNNEYLEKLEEDVKICTALSLDECNTYGIKYQISNSYVYYTDNSPFYGYYWDSENIYINPEKCLVDYYYKEYSQPAKILETCVKSDAFDSGLNGTQLTGEMMTEYITGLYPNDEYAAPNERPYRIMRYEQSLKHKATNITLRQYKTWNNEQLPT